MIDLPRVHWIYGSPSINKLKIVENEIKNRNGSYVNIDFDLLKRRYVCRYASYLGTKYMGEENAIIESLDIITDDKLEMSRIKRLIMLFHPSVCRMQLVDYERWRVKDVYIISSQSPSDFYERLPLKSRPRTLNDFLNMINVIKHVCKVIELPV